MPKSFTYEVLTEETPRKTYGGNDQENNSSKYSNSNGTTIPIPPSSLSLCQCQNQRASCPSPTCKKRVVQNGNPPNHNPSNMSITVHADADEHCHDDELQQEFDKKARKKLWIASILCVIFMVGEGVGGYISNSLAVATDAAHLLADFASFMISLFALYMAQRPATKHLSYGYHRAEVIGALTSVLLIWVVTGILVFMAIQRIASGEIHIDALTMLITSGVGLIVNIIMGCTLHQHGHGHSHGGGGNHSHSDGHGVHTDHGGHSDIEASSGSTSSASSPSSEHAHNSKSSENRININVRAAFIHVVGDFIQSVGVFVAAIVIYFEPSWGIVDPICTFFFSVLVLATTYSIIKDAVVVLMEGIPKGLDFNEVREGLLSVKGVCKVHNLRIWSLSMDRIALSAHLAVDPNCASSSKSILRRASSLMRKKFGFCEVTIQIEEFNESMQDCVRCQELN